mmetsp:Transcript_22130/g.32931  ORF Transcript_22130/g.32931 Transcript_22130/m.32931 type:complete len:249 (+) Transcript_22130:42-788(+)
MSDLTTADIILSVLGIIFGLIIGCFGYKLFRYVLFVVGFTIGSGITYGLLESLADLDDWANILIAVVVGLIVGVLSMVLWIIGLFALGALCGVIVACVIQSTADNGLIQEDWGIYLMISLFALFFGIIAVVLQKLVIILSTSTLGAYAVIASIGVLSYPEGSFGKVIQAAIENDFDIIDADWRTYVLLASWAVLAVIFVIIQFCWSAKNHNHRTAGYVIVFKTDGGYETINDGDHHHHHHHAETKWYA